MNKNLIIKIIVLVLIIGGLYFLQKPKGSEKSPGGAGNIKQEDKITVNQPQISGAAKTLDLSSKNLTTIPSYVFGRTDLKELNISHNFLRGSIPSEIKKLQKLEILNASFNQMTGIPAEIGQLENLVVLDLSYNNIIGLPQELGNLKKLKMLNLAGNSYSQQDLDYIKSKLPADTLIIGK